MRAALALLRTKRLPPGQGFRDAKARFEDMPAAPSHRDWAVDPQLWTELDTLQYLRQTKVLIGSIVRILDEMPPGGQDVEPQPKERPLRSTIPPFPVALSPASLTKYIEALSKYEYVRPPLRMSDALGVITRMIQVLVQPRNAATRHQLTSEACNAAICHFLRLPDVRSARSVLHHMHVAPNCPPTAQTYHQFLASQARQISKSPYPAAATGYRHPLYMVLRTLEEMRNRQHKASWATWNHVFRAMPMGFGKSFVYEEMSKRNISLDGLSRAMWYELWDLDEAIETALVSEELDTEVVAMLVRRLLHRKQPDQANVRQAFKLLRYAIDSRKVLVSPELMNACLGALAPRGRIDWCFGLVGFFVDRGIIPTSYTWEHMLKCVVRMPRSPENVVGAMAGAILGRAIELPLTARARIAARHLSRRLSSFQDCGRKHFDELVASLSWTNIDEAPPGYENAAVLVQQAASEVGAWGTPPAYSLPQWTSLVVDSQLLQAVPRTDSNEARSKLKKELASPRGALRQTLSQIETLN